MTLTTKNPIETQRYEHDDTASAKKVLLVDSSGTSYTVGSSPILTTRIDEASSTVTYIGKATVGSAESSSVWQIQKIEESGTETIFKFADGNSNFDKKWSERSILNYS